MFLIIHKISPFNPDRDKYDALQNATSYELSFLHVKPMAHIQSFAEVETPSQHRGGGPQKRLQPVVRALQTVFSKSTRGL
jgi:hypothetical protein